MPSFAEFFLKSKGRPIVYSGNTLQMVDCLHAAAGQTFKVRFEAVNSEWRQGVHLRTDGTFEVNNQIVSKSIELWSDSAPPEVVLKVYSKKGKIQVRNVWDTGDGAMQSWHNGAAMIVDEISGGRRYRCNDGHPDEDFADLIFSIEPIEK